MKKFTIIWSGQLISTLGTGLTNFALGYWVYETHGSATQFTLIAVFSLLTTILISPYAGALVDRWDRRKTMIWADSGAALCTFGLALLFFLDRLEVWHIYVNVILRALCQAFQSPAFDATVSLLVPPDKLTRANGMLQTNRGLNKLLSPLLGGVLIATIGVWGVFVIDAVTFLIGVSPLLFLKIPNPEKPETAEGPERSLLQDAMEGWHYITGRKGLMMLVLFFAMSNFFIEASTILFVPMILGSHDADNLGMILSCGGAGFLLGGMMMSSWGGPKSLVKGLWAAASCYAFSVFLLGLSDNGWYLAAMAFFSYMCYPFILSLSQSIWQRKVPPHLQGRVFAIRTMIAWSSIPLAYVLSGPAADFLFEPMFTVNGALAGSIGPLIGTGQGRGIAFMFVTTGAFLVFATTLMFRHPRLWHLESEIEDALPKRRESSDPPDVGDESEAPAPAS